MTDQKAQGGKASPPGRLAPPPHPKRKPTALKLAYGWHTAATLTTYKRCKSAYRRDTIARI